MDSGRPDILSATSPGVRRITAIAESFTKWQQWALFISLFLVTYAYGLDQVVRNTYQGYATASFGQSSLLSTVGVVRSIVAAAAQPAFAKISDVFGRMTIFAFCTVLYVVGTIIEATANDTGGFSAGAILFQFGFTGIILLVQILIADTTSLRNRVFFMWLPQASYIINVWVSGNVAEATLKTTTWRWGIGMWAIVFPVATIPLFCVLWDGERRAKREGLLDNVPPAYKSLFRKDLLTELFWQMDVVGLFLLAASLSLVLLPFTLAGGQKAQWKTAKVLTTLLVGILITTPAFLFWEAKYARHPVVPARILKNRTVLAGLALGALLNVSFFIQADYLFPIVFVAFDQSILSSTRILNLFTFSSVLVGFAVGAIAHYVRRVKWFVVGGACIFTLGYGLLIHYRGGSTGTRGNLSGLIAGQILFGIAGGLGPYCTLALMQSTVKHEHLAIIVALFLSIYNVGSAMNVPVPPQVGYSISGAIWTQTLYPKLLSGLGDPNLAAFVYADPYTFAMAFPVGTPQREAVIIAYREVQKLLCITGTCVSVLLIITALLLQDIYLVDTRSRLDAEEAVDGKDTRSLSSDRDKEASTP